MKLLLSVEWNGIMENILEKIRIKVRKNKDENFNILSELGTDC